MPDAVPSQTWRPEARATIALALPLVGANLLQMAVYAVDVMFVSRLGTKEFAAATLGVFLLSLIHWGLMGLTGACAPIIAAQCGRKAHSVREVRRSFRMALWLAALVAVPLILFLLQARAVLEFAGQDTGVSERAAAFLNIVAFALIPSVAANIMRVTAAALGRPRWAMVVTTLALGLNIMFNYLLVFGHAGFPALGLEGSALASLLTSMVSCCVFAFILTVDRRLRRYRLFGRFWRAEWVRLRSIAKLGIPIALSWTMEGSLFGGAAILMGLISAESVAAHSIALNIASISFQIPLGIAQAGTIRVGKAFGARNQSAIALAGWTTIAMGTAVQLAAALLIWMAPQLLISAYIDVHDPANAIVVQLAAKLLAICAIFQLSDGAQTVLGGALRGLQDTRMPMLIAAFGYWICGFGTAIMLGFKAGWQGQGIWAGLAVGVFVVACLLLWRWSMRGSFGLLPFEKSSEP